MTGRGRLLKLQAQGRNPISFPVEAQMKQALLAMSHQLQNFTNQFENNKLSPKLIVLSTGSAGTCGMVAGFMPLIAHTNHGH